MDDAALQCITDLVDCCGTESDSPMRTVIEIIDLASKAQGMSSSLGL